MSEEEVGDWIPPELLARAKEAAERNAKTAERLAQPKRSKREGLGAPEPRNPRFAFITAGLCAAFLLAGRAAGLLEGGFGGGISTAILLDWTSFLLTLLLYLKFMLPVLKKRHRLVLRALLVCKLACDAAYAAVKAFGQPEETANGLTLALAALMASPLFVLLYGVLRRRSTEKAAGLLQLLLVATVLLIAIFNAHTVQNVMKLLQAGCLVLLLINWPVLSQPAFPAFAARQKRRYRER